MKANLPALYYDKQGQPITAGEWSRLFKSNRHIGYKRLWLGYVKVSTVWLGLNHSFTPDSPPLIFETIVFRRGHMVAQERYSTLEQALAGHDYWVNYNKNLAGVFGSLVSDVE